MLFVRVFSTRMEWIGQDYILQHSLSGDQMKKELDYFKAENLYGGSQDWFTDPLMKFGGCAAIAACESCMYYDLHHGTKLYPYEKNGFHKKDYLDFGKMMKPYLHPRLFGISRLEMDQLCQIVGYRVRKERRSYFVSNAVSICADHFFALKVHWFNSILKPVEEKIQYGKDTGLKAGYCTKELLAQ